VTEAGFTARLLSQGAASSRDRVVLRVEGMTCSSCSSAVEVALRGVEGVHKASVNLLAAQAEVAPPPLVLCHGCSCFLVGAHLAWVYLLSQRACTNDCLQLATPPLPRSMA